MSETRRGAFRLNHGEAGTLRFGAHAATCVVVDNSATGARLRLHPPALVPDRVTLATEIAGTAIELRGRLRRAEPGAVVAIRFDDPESTPLPKLLNEAQRQLIAAGMRPDVERRRARRGQTVDER